MPSFGHGMILVRIKWMIQDHSGHGTSKEPSDAPSKRVILDHWSWYGSSRRKEPLEKTLYSASHNSTQESLSGISTEFRGNLTTYRPGNRQQTNISTRGRGLCVNYKCTRLPVRWRNVTETIHSTIVKPCKVRSNLWFLCYLFIFALNLSLLLSSFSVVLYLGTLWSDLSVLLSVLI